MAHMIGTADRGYSKAKPWHYDRDTADRWSFGRGILTPEQAAEIGWARQDGGEGYWNPRLTPVYARADHDAFVMVPGTFQVVRDDMATDDARRFLCAGRGVSAAYHPITNTDIVEYCDALTDGGAFVDACGSIRNGRRVWMSLELPHKADIVGEPASAHILMTTAHNGSASFEAILATVLTVCNNTMQWNRRGAQTRYKIRHTASATARLAQASRIITVAAANFASTVTILRNLAAKRISDQTADAFVRELLPSDSTRTENVRNHILTLYHGHQIGAELVSRRGTAFGIVNAVSQYIETAAQTRSTDGRPVAESRADSALFGAGSRLRDKAMNLAVAML